MPFDDSRKKLIDTKGLEDVIELVLLSGRIKNADPLSLIVSSKVGAGKTEILKQYAGTKGVRFITEATAFGIKTEFLEEIQSGEIRHLIIGDLLVPLSKQKKTRDDFIAFFNTIMEEGVKSIHTYAQHWEGNSTVKCGLITTIAEQDLLRKSRRWFEMGFLTRAIPLTYGYSADTRYKIYKHLATSQNISEMPSKKIWLPTKPVTVKQNTILNMRLIEYAMRVEKWENVYGFRRLEQLQTLLMANALKNKRLCVTKADFEKVMELSKFINLDFKEI